MGKIRWSEVSQNDLEQIGDFIAMDSPAFAISFIEKILESTVRLGKFPGMGRVVPEFNSTQIRELIYQNYRIVYLLKDDNNVFILTISHGSMDLKKKVKKENWEI